MQFPDGSKKYGIIYADVPRTYNDRLSCGKNGAYYKYNLMSDEEIDSLPVQSIAADDCALFSWVTYPTLQRGLDTVKAWGFEYKTVAFTWIKISKAGKPTMGLGRWTRGNAEICLLATRGKPKRISAAVRQVVIARNVRHSQKPNEVRDRIVDLLGPLPRIELFARKRTDGWDAYGDQI